MQIHGTSHIHGPHGLQGPHNPRFQANRSLQSPAGPIDQLDISAAAEAVIQSVENGDMRTDLVARVRGEIAAGKYETPAKLDAALDNLLNEIG